MIHEIELFLLGAGTGMALSVLFDLLRAFRISKIHPGWAVALEDFFFWCIVSGTLFCLIQVFNKGVLRFYIYFGFVLGAVFYYLTITKLIFPVFLMVFKVIKYVLSKCCLIFGIILKIIKNLFILPLKKIWKGIKILYTNI